MRNAIRRAIDQSAGAARKIALQEIAKDANVPVARIRPGVSKVVRTSQTRLSASFTASKVRVGILNTAGATVSRRGGLSASTHVSTGGGSSHLHVQKAFVIRANGGRFVAYRKGKGRLSLKAIYAEMPSTAMGQDDAAARKAWQKSAEVELSVRLGREIQRQFYSEKLSAASPSDSSD
jgi:hypothetical protein